MSKRVLASCLLLVFAGVLFRPGPAEGAAPPVSPSDAQQSVRASAAPPVKVLLNGREIKFEVEPLIEDETTLVPFRALAEVMGIGVRWDAETRSVYAANDTIKIRLQIGDTGARINGTPRALMVPPKLINNRTVIPLRFFFEAFGARVTWEGETRTIRVDYAIPGRQVIAFYAISSYAGLQKHNRYLAEISTKWFVLGADGRVNADYPEGYRDAFDLARGKGIRATALIFQDDPKILHGLLNNPAARAQAARDLAALAARDGYAGINLDLESILPEDRDAFTSFVRELSSGLELPLAVTVPAKDSDDLPWIKAYDYAALGDLADRLVIMAYGEHYPFGDPGPVASLGWFKRVAAFAASQVPRAKLSVGVGIYGTDWTVAGGKVSPSGPLTDKAQVPGGTASQVSGGAAAQVAGRTDDLTTLTSRTAEFKVPLEWDEASSTPRYSYLDRTGGRHEVWLENARSISAKMAVLRDLGIRSLAVWRLGIVPEDVWGAVEADFLRK